jgi:hypothetical protein
MVRLQSELKNYVFNSKRFMNIEALDIRQQSDSRKLIFLN